MDVTGQISLVSGGSRVLSTLWHKALPLGAPIAIFALALALRFYGLDWDRGFPYTPHPDERAILMRVAEISPPPLGDLGVLLDADESPWNPRWFPYGSLPLYLLKGIELVYALGPGDDLQDLRLAGRTMSALADVGTVALVFLLGTRIYGRRVGLLASALTAMAVIHIQLSHFFAVDTLLVLFTIAAVFFMYKVAREGRLGDSLLAGACVGLGLATKVSLAPIYAAFVVAHLMYLFSMSGGGRAAAPVFSRGWPAALKGLAAGAAVSLLVLFVAQPYAFLDASRFFGDVFEQSEMARRIRDYPYTRQYIDTTPYWYHVRQLATWGLGWPLGVVAWAGLLFVSLRGLRLRYGLTYLGVGWMLPIAILLVSTHLLAILGASGIAILALLATLPFRSADSRADVLLLSWVVPSLLITGSLQVKFLRYLAPVTPFLVLFGSRMLFAVWASATSGDRGPALRPWLLGGLVLLLGSTAFYALAYMSVYRQPHTAVRTSEWIQRNAPPGSVILKEHWEEGIPNLGAYSVRELPLYHDDVPQKTRTIAGELARGDYFVFFSNRLYGTIPRLPERYPVTSAYYRLLFSGGLGYELVDFQATYPKLLGVSFVDDTFSRPDVPEPGALRSYSPSTLALDLGFADESFSVYDHPKVLLFENVGHLSSETIRLAIENAAPPYPSYPSSPRASGNARTLGLMMSPEQAEAQQRGGTWSDIVDSSGWTSRLPVLAWLIVVEGIALLTLPVAFVVFRPLPDRGFLFAKALGLLAVALPVWLLASLRWMTFSQGSIAVALLLLSAVSALIISRRRREMAAFVRERWPLLAIGEVVFLVAFFVFIMLRMANPDLWHPFRGGEKPMDMAYLNAVLRSSYMPPYDPWFGGGYLNYYYWGQFIVATLIRATGIDPSVAVNLAVPLFFALTAAGSFSVVYNLAEATRRRLRSPKPPQSVEGYPDALQPASGGSRPGRRMPWSPVMAGLGGIIFVTVLGNLDGAVQVGQGVWRALFRSAPFGEFDFWRSTRMMPPDPPGHEITEFPYFTFLFADPHAHLWALPFTLLALGLALAVVMAVFEGGRRRGDWGVDEVVRLAVLGVAVGSLMLINAWDFPTYLAIAVAAVFLADYFVHGGLGLNVIVSSGVKSLFVLVVGYLVFLPFHASNETFFDSLESTTNQTVLWQFLAVSGLSIFVVGSFFVSESRDWLMAAGRALGRGSAWMFRAVSSADGDPAPEDRPWPAVQWVSLAVAVLGLVLFGFALTAIFSGVAGSTIPFVAVLLALVAVSGFRWLLSPRPDSPLLVFVAVIVGIALAIPIGLDVFKVEGDIDRMNSVFKFYLQMWVLLGLTSAYMLWRLAHGKRVPLIRLAWGKKAWVAALAVLVLSASVYPVMGTQDRLRDRFDGLVLPLTLDGTAFVEGAVYHDRKGDIDLAADYEGIRWLRDNVQGSPIVLEATTPSEYRYQWNGRVSVNTGLPSVVGWQWHQEQQRWGYRWAVGRRIQDVNTIYSTSDPSGALTLLRGYGVEYVYVGQVERLYYPGAGLSKFDGALKDHLERVFLSEQVAIYRVRDGSAESER